MNLRTFIASECANFNDGICSGLTATNDRFQKECACIALEGEKCDYLETTVAPIIEWPDPTTNSGLRRKQAQAFAAYQRSVDTADLSGNTCNVCGCPVKCGKRYCSVCRESRRRETLKSGMRQYRTNRKPQRKREHGHEQTVLEGIA